MASDDDTVDIVTIPCVVVGRAVVFWFLPDSRGKVTVRDGVTVDVVEVGRAVVVRFPPGSSTGLVRFPAFVVWFTLSGSAWSALPGSA